MQLAKNRGQHALARYIEDNYASKKLKKMMKKAKQAVQLKNIMKSRVLYHKYLLEESFRPVIDPSHVNPRSKLLTLLFTAVFLLLIFLFTFIRNSTIKYLTRPTMVFKTRLKSAPRGSHTSLDSPQDGSENSPRSGSLESLTDAFWSPVPGTEVPAKRLNEFSQNLFILLLIISILYIVSYLYMSGESDSAFILDSVILLLSQFSLFYVLVTVVCIIFAKTNIGLWLNFEANIAERVQIYRKFERMYIKEVGRNYSLDQGARQSTSSNESEVSENGLSKPSGGLSTAEKKEYADLKKMIKFIVLRQEFLCPTFMPIMRESVLRDDFRFADYLGKCFYKTLAQTLEMRLSTLISFLTFLMIYAGIRLVFPERWEVLAMTLLSFVFFGIQVALKYKTEVIFSQLSAPLRTPYEFQVSPFDAVRNPNSNIGKIFTPQYLKSHFRTARATKNRLINSQEALFWLRSPVFCMRLLHFCLIFQITLMIVFWTNYYEEFLRSWLSVGMCCFSVVLYCFNLFVVFPITVKNFAIVTNVRKNQFFWVNLGGFLCWLSMIGLVVTG